MGITSRTHPLLETYLVKYVRQQSARAVFNFEEAIANLMEDLFHPVGLSGSGVHRGDRPGPSVPSPNPSGWFV